MKQRFQKICSMNGEEKREKGWIKNRKSSEAIQKGRTEKLPGKKLQLLEESVDIFKK